MLDIYLKYVIIFRLLSEEYDIDKEESKKDDNNVVNDAHSTLGDSNNKLYENIETETNENKESDINTNPKIKKKN